MAKRYTIDDMQEYAKDKGGLCMSKEYVDSTSPLKWRCEKGHTWDADFEIIRQGGWCRQCLKKEHDIIERFEKIKAIAIAKGGKCLSTEFINMKEKLDFECAEGHRWSVAPGGILNNNQWCSKCAYKKLGMNSRDPIEMFQKIAADHGGKLLSLTYSGSRDKLLWECKEGHQWYANAFCIKRIKTWCPECSGKLPLTIEDMKNDAAKHGGECLSTEYLGVSKQLKWKCSEGHVWMAKPNNIRSGNWCDICAHKRIGDFHRDNIETFHEIAKKRGGKCLSTTYVRNLSKLEFECSEGHRWKAAPIGIKNMNNWCPKCARVSCGIKNREDIAIYHKIAKERGGRCLEFTYKGNRVIIKLECAEGHSWTIEGHAIKQGNWCFKCAHKRIAAKQFDTIETFHAIAKENGGKVLSKEYVSSLTKMEFQCSEGHVFWASASNIKNNRLWCIICNKIKRDKPKNKIERFKQLAIEKGGKCLSEVCYNTHDKLDWECAEGHRWTVSGKGIVCGNWCKKCASKSNAMKQFDTIENIQEIAKKHGGKCLSEVYVNNTTKMKFQCSEGHIWMSTPGNIKNNPTWCVVCNKNNKKKSIKPKI
ncbi:MAG: hypothetical protein WCL14_02075 [Bacteroidota bacterium]